MAIAQYQANEASEHPQWDATKATHAQLDR